MISSAFLSLFVATPLFAEIKVDIRNCTGEKIDIKSYNAKDGSQLNPYTKKNDVKPGRKVTLKCKGQGKGFCKIKVNGLNCGGSFSDVAFHRIDKNTTSVVDATGEWKKRKSGNLKGTYPLIELHRHVEDPSSDCYNYNEISCP